MTHLPDIQATYVYVCGHVEILSNDTSEYILDNRERSITVSKELDHPLPAQIGAMPESFFSILDLIEHHSRAEIDVASGKFCHKVTAGRWHFKADPLSDEQRKLNIFQEDSNWGIQVIIDNYPITDLTFKQPNVTIDGYVRCMDQDYCTGLSVAIR